ncbi:MAG: NUDIX hydrolase [Alphaproteobacteria bacterium]|nr:NUDIX hydrolase [Alphaproteobacteria bacterium]
MEKIRVIDANTPSDKFSANLADCVILTKNNRLLMQQRPDNWKNHAGVLNIFGGHIEKGETIQDGLIRELREELGAVVKPKDVTFIGTITEDWTNHTEAVHIHFWHDKEGTITGCYECEAIEYNSAEEALKHPKIMDYAAWALNQCKTLNLIP